LGYFPLIDMDCRTPAQFRKATTIISHRQAGSMPPSPTPLTLIWNNSVSSQLEKGIRFSPHTWPVGTPLSSYVHKRARLGGPNPKDTPEDVAVGCSWAREAVRSALGGGGIYIRLLAQCEATKPSICGMSLVRVSISTFLFTHHRKIHPRPRNQQVAQS